MKIKRSGHGAFHGWSEIDLGTDMSARWNGKLARVVLVNAEGVRGFGGNARHDYEILVAPEEVGAMLSAMAKAAETPAVAAAVKDQLGPMIRLINAGANAE